MPTPYYILRDKFFRTTEQQERLLDLYRASRFKRGRSLRPIEREALYAFAWKTTNTIAKRYYRKRQSLAKDWFDVPNVDHQAVSDRLMLFLNHLVDSRYTYPPHPKEHRSSGWMFVTYKRRFVEFETRRELESMGVGLDNRPGMPIRHWTEVAKLERQRVDQGLPPGAVRQLWEAEQTRLNRPTTDKRWENFVLRWEKYKTLRGLHFNSTEEVELENPNISVVSFWETL